MRFLSRAGLWLALLAAPAAVITSGCTSEKEEDPQPTPTTGSLSGTVSPAGALSKVTATDAGGLTFVATPDAAGAFSIKDLQPGSYTLTFAPATGYTAPADRSITIVAGQNVGAGTVSVDSDGSIRSGTVTWTVDGTNYSTTNVLGSLTANSFGGTALSFGATATMGNIAYEVEVDISGMLLAPGTYRLQRATGPGFNTASYEVVTNGIPGAYYGVDVGTFTIVSYDATGRILTGTFSYKADSFNSSTFLTVNVTNGTFRLQL